MYPLSLLFFFTVTATTEIYTLSLHDALPIYDRFVDVDLNELLESLKDDFDLMIEQKNARLNIAALHHVKGVRSEEHTSELQSQSKLVCRLLLDKKKLQSQTNLVCRLLLEENK